MHNVFFLFRKDYVVVNAKLTRTRTAGAAVVAVRLAVTLPEPVPFPLPVAFALIPHARLLPLGHFRLAVVVIALPRRADVLRPIAHSGNSIPVIPLKHTHTNIKDGYVARYFKNTLSTPIFSP